MAQSSIVRVFACLAIIFVIVHAYTDDEEWENYKKKHRRGNYKHKEEHDMRYGHFKTAKSVIDNHNAEHAQGKHTYTLALNHMADRTPEEKAAMLRPMYSDGDATYATRMQPSAAVVAPTTYKDWTTTAYVPPVRDQGACGSCYTFSSTDAMAFYYNQANNLSSPIVFSTQELVDCLKEYLTGTAASGCSGGNPNQVFNYTQNRGIDQDYSDPYTGQTYYDDLWSGNCTRNSSAAVTVFTNTTVNPYGVAGAGNETAMAAYLGTTGVGVVYIFAVCDQFMYYKSGVLSNVCSVCTNNSVPINCSGIDHAVLAVAYSFNTTANISVYKIKNSWAITWGELGFVYVAFGNNEMNIANYGVMYPVGIGKQSSPTQPLLVLVECTLPSSGCASGCTGTGACCTSDSSCFSGNCDTTSGMCMPTCTASNVNTTCGYVTTSGSSYTSHGIAEDCKTAKSKEPSPTCVNGKCQCFASSS